MANVEVVSPVTLVLIGRTGNGKSATGNSILGRKEFDSGTRAYGVTRNSEVHSCVWNGRQKINVIDTPGLFDASVTKERVAREIVKCMKMVTEGFHAIIFVFSVRTRFSQEEESAIQILQKMFGTNIVDYIIVVFTGGDELEDNDETMEDYMGQDCPVALKDILAICNNRCVLVNNKTKSDAKKAEQRDKLLGMVNEVIKNNGGEAYTHELFSNINYDAKLKEVTTKLEQQLDEERKERMKAQHIAEQSKKKYADEIAKLTERLNLSIQSQKSSAEILAIKEMINEAKRERERDRERDREREREREKEREKDRQRQRERENCAIL